MLIVKSFLFSVCVLFFMITSSFAGSLIEVEGRYWVADLEGKAKVTTASSVGTDINLKDDLGVKDEDLPEVRATLSLLGSSKLRLAYTQVGYSGNQDITRAVVFDGQTYSLGVNVDSDVDLQYIRLGWIWEFLNISDKIKISSLIEAKVFIIEASLTTPVISESENFTGGVPSLGAIVEFQPFNKIGIFAEVSGIDVGRYGTLYDAEIGIKINPIDSISINVGYRTFDLNFENDSDYAKLKITGPFFSGEFRF